MKRIYATLVLLGLLATGAYAQRYCDIETVLISPAEGTTLPCTGTFPIKYLFINHGPDAIEPTDTLVGLDPEVQDPETGSFIYYGNTAAVGDTIVGYDTLTSLSLTGALLNTTGDTVVTPDFPDGNYLYFAMFFGFSDTAAIKDTVPDNDRAFHSVTINCGTGIGDVVKGLDRTSLSTYPNPAGNSVSFKYSFTKGNAAVRITDIAGRVVFTQDFGKQTAGEKTLSVDVSSLTNGMYYLELVTDERRAISSLSSNGKQTLFILNRKRLPRGPFLL